MVMHQSLAAFWIWVSLLAQPLQTHANMKTADMFWINFISHLLIRIKISSFETALPWWKTFELKEAAGRHRAP
jgi:hypothetical protein